MQICIVVGSVRKHSESARIGDHIKKLLSKSNPDITIKFIALRDAELPLWDEDNSDPESSLFKKWSPISKVLENSDGFIIITPEWAGMVPPHLKNLLLLCGSELAHKPAQVVSVSSGMGGAYPVSELRITGTKNNLMIILPDHILLRNVRTLFTEETTDLDTSLNERIEYSMNFLIESAKAMKPVREKHQNLKKYGYGM